MLKLARGKAIIGIGDLKTSTGSTYPKWCLNTKKLVPVVSIIWQNRDILPLTNEPCHGKTKVLHMQKQRHRSTSWLYQHLYFRYIESTIRLLS